MSRSEVTCWDCGETLGFGSIATLRCGDCAHKFLSGTGGLDPNRFYDETSLFGEAMDDYLTLPELALIREYLAPRGGAFDDEHRWMIDPILEKLAEGNAVEIHKNMTVR